MELNQVKYSKLVNTYYNFVHMLFLKKSLIFILSFVFLFTIISCDEQKGGEASSNATMQQARGETGEIILVMPPDDWESEIGDLIRDIFMSTVEVLPQDEALYNLRRTDPSKFNKVLKSSKNLMFVATLDNNTSEGRQIKRYFTENSIEQIEKNPNLYSFNQKDVYARGQEVLYLFGRNEEELIKNIKNNKSGIREFFNDKESKRLIANYKKSTSKGIMNFIEDSLGVELIVPYGFDIAVKQENFIWIRELDQLEELNIWMVKTPFTDESVFDPANIKELREEFGKKYIVDKDNPDLYLTRQDEKDFVIDTINLNGNYALQIKGLWKYSDNSRGGAFVSYLFANEENGNLYYLEGYLDNPSKDKREPMRKLKAILGTADFPEAIND